MKMNVQESNVKLSVWEKFAFGAGNGAFCVLFGMSLGMLTFFWTDVLLIPASLTATFLMVSKIWDAINDPLIGSIADRKFMAGGSYKKWLWSFIPLNIC